MKKIKEKQPLNRVTPPTKEGLNDEQINERINKGYTNKIVDNVEKSYGRIIFDNFFNPFNVVLICIALTFLFFVIYLNCIGKSDVADRYFGFSKFTFLIVLFLNSGIGTYQEFHSKRTINKLKIVNEAKVIAIRNGKQVEIRVSDIAIDDILYLKAGSQVGADLKILEGEVEVDESLLTGESDFIKKQVGSTLYSGSLIMVGACYCLVEKVGNDTYASELSAKVKKLSKHKSELMTNIYNLIKILSIVLVVVVAIVIGTLCYKINKWGSDLSVWGTNDGLILDLGSADTWARIFLSAGAFAVGVIPSGLILMTSVTLAVSIVKLAKEKTMIQELFSLENLSRVDTICLDKTGTLTDGSMEVEKIIPFIEEEKIISYIKKFNFGSNDENQTAYALKNKFGTEECTFKEFKSFSSKTKKSALIIDEQNVLTLGAPDYLLNKEGKEYEITQQLASEGKRVIAFCLNDNPIALFILKDNIRSSSKETIEFFYENNVDVKIISGDNLFTVAKIAKTCGVKNTDKAISLENMPEEKLREIVDQYTIFARVSPEQKQIIVESLQAKGKKVAMTGDGVNDILALRKANASITFSKATDAAKACSDVVLLDNDFVHLKEVVAQGRRVVNNIQRTATLFLMKTFSIATLAVCLIPFKRGQMWFSFENVYLMQTCVIAVGGFALSLEGSKNPIEGTFKSNVLPKAFISSILMTLAVLIPIWLNQLPQTFNNASPIISNNNVSTLISIMTVCAGIIVLITMCIPFTKYRLAIIGVVIISAIILAFASPTSYIGGKATPFTMFKSSDGNIFHSQFFHECFQPWNCQSVKDIATDKASYITLALFFVIDFTLYFFTIFFLNKYKEKHKKLKSNNINGQS